ncbi:MAG: 16S rRNA (cytidine(1402)-2'-O)-methyltransferase [Pseudomonadales bacterium]
MTVGVLYVVATPIGNMDDMVPRAVNVLQQVSVIAVEDTRHSGRLLQHFSINTPLVAYHEHNEQAQAKNLVQRMLDGEEVALISDAGTPLVSDPGYRLVKLAQENEVRVVPVPGACALIAALSASGLPSDRFSFEGFLPAKVQQRKKILAGLSTESRSLIFYESPHRIVDSLADMVEAFGAERLAVLAREITKTFETIRQLPLAELHAWVVGDSNQQRGEIVVLIEGAREQANALSGEVIHLLTVLAEELPPNQAASLAAKATGCKRKELYQWLIDHH